MTSAINVVSDPINLPTPQILETKKFCLEIAEGTKFGGYFPMRNFITKLDEYNTPKEHPLYVAMKKTETIIYCQLQRIKPLLAHAVLSLTCWIIKSQITNNFDAQITVLILAIIFSGFSLRAVCNLTTPSSEELTLRTEIKQLLLQVNPTR